MAVKKKPSESDAIENKPIVHEEETIDAGVPDEELNKHIGKPASFCVYIGPSIRGVIQSGTIFDKSLEDTKAFLATAIEKYPLIGKLISTDKTIAEDRIKVKTAGNLLNVYYTKLASGKSN